MWAPNTEHHPGKASRKIPIFAQMWPYLEEARELAADDAEYVVGGEYLKAAQSPTGWRNCNLRTQLHRLIDRAGLERWPKPFQALRSSKETELSHHFPLHVVTDWIGNTPKVALKHYLQVTDADFQKAVQSGAGPVQIPVPNLHAKPRANLQEMKKALGKQGLTRTIADWHDNAPFVQVEGSQPSSKFPKSLNLRISSFKLLERIGIVLFGSGSGSDGLRKFCCTKRAKSVVRRVRHSY